MTTARLRNPRECLVPGVLEYSDRHGTRPERTGPALAAGAGVCR